MLLELSEIIQESSAFLCYNVTLLRPILGFDQTKVQKHTQILLEKTEAQVSKIHNPGFKGTILGNLEDVCCDLDTATVLSLPPVYVVHADPI